MSGVLTAVFYLLVMVFVFGILIFIHEFGHFFTARKCGVEIKEFAIGMGPTVFSWKSKKYETKYALRAFPIGGFVACSVKMRRPTTLMHFATKRFGKECS
jgi:regulator of sigma E protease